MSIIYDITLLPIAFVNYVNENLHSKPLADLVLDFYPELGAAVDRLQKYHTDVFSEDRDPDNLLFTFNNRKHYLIQLFVYYISNRLDQAKYDADSFCVWELLGEFDSYWSLDDYKLLSKLFPKKRNILAAKSATNFCPYTTSPNNDERYVALQWFIDAYGYTLDFSIDESLFEDPEAMYPEAKTLIDKYYNYTYDY